MFISFLLVLLSFYICQGSEIPSNQYLIANEKLPTWELLNLFPELLLSTDLTSSTGLIF